MKEVRSTRTRAVPLSNRKEREEILFKNTESYGGRENPLLNNIENHVSGPFSCVERRWELPDRLGQCLT